MSTRALIKQMAAPDGFKALESWGRGLPAESLPGGDGNEIWVVQLPHNVSSSRRH